VAFHIINRQMTERRMNWKMDSQLTRKRKQTNIALNFNLKIPNSLLNPFLIIF